MAGSVAVDPVGCCVPSERASIFPGFGGTKTEIAKPLTLSLTAEG